MSADALVFAVVNGCSQENSPAPRSGVLSPLSVIGPHGHHEGVRNIGRDFLRLQAVLQFGPGRGVGLKPTHDDRNGGRLLRHNALIRDAGQRS